VKFLRVLREELGSSTSSGAVPFVKLQTKAIFLIDRLVSVIIIHFVISASQISKEPEKKEFDGE